MKRRDFIKYNLAMSAAMALSGCAFVRGKDEAGFDYVLVAKQANVELMPGKVTPAMTFNGVAPAPTLRVKQGARLRVKLINELTMETTIHWHGIRIDNKMDGTPYLTQPPVMPGETFVYDFVVPDAGTFWYHPHVHSVEQLGKGMVGLLIVEEKDNPGFDADIPLVLKKWHLKDNGEFGQISKPRLAARMGTPGTWQTVNQSKNPQIDIPAGGAIRLRFANLDNTIDYDLLVDHPDVFHIAYDGMPLVMPRPQTIDYAVGAGMRVDTAFIAPVEVGKEIAIYRVRGQNREVLCRLLTTPAKFAPRTKIPQLPANPIALPDLAQVQKLRFTFDWSGAVAPKTEHGHPSFWAINKTPWMEMESGKLPPPLAKLQLGKHYNFELVNTSQYHHPIHLHGVVFTVLSSNKRSIDPYQADTVMLGKYETIQMAFVADNLGKWMYHCHLIEHMKTGLMGYIEIS